MNLKQLIALFSTTALLLSCAQIVPITGGVRDIEHPKEVGSFPENGSTNFTEKTITIEFDEFIKLTNISSQLIVSPLMETTPEILVRGKKLVIKLEDKLTKNTTYSLNFGNAITDITEDNPFPNYKYVFSTGTYLDSLSYSGSILNAFDLSPKENIYVLLYDQFEDSLPYKELPRYVALTDKEGLFSITNIAYGKYKFFAINDINSNYLFDLPNEEIAFKNETVQLDSSSADNHVYLFEEKNGLQYVVKTESEFFGKIDVQFNLPTNNLKITPLNTLEEEPWLIEKNEVGDSLTLWLTLKNKAESLDIVFTDTEEIIDTSTIDIIGDLIDTFLFINTNISSAFDLNQNIILETNRPFKTFASDSIKLYEDSILITTAHFEGLGVRKFELAYDYKENTNYQLFIPPNTFEDIYGLKNDTIKIDFKTKSESDYGIINLTIHPNFSEDYIVQLFKNNQLIKQRFLLGKETENYKYLLPGSYQLKLIIDSNGDKKWNTGNYLEGLQPEKVIYYEKEIKVRANWDNDIIWTINK